jgi:hypothetical protein
LSDPYAVTKPTGQMLNMLQMAWRRAKDYFAGTGSFAGVDAAFCAATSASCLSLSTASVRLT